MKKSDFLFQQKKGIIKTLYDLYKYYEYMYLMEKFAPDKAYYERQMARVVADMEYIDKI